MPNWTEAQRAAIDARNPEILVSAAAGSGKTAVLVERVQSLLRDGLHVDDMLICTFTRAAASEMRERLSRALEDDPALAAEARRLPYARISTLHVFCDRLLRQHFQAAGVDPMYAIVSGPRREAMRTEAAEAAMETLCASDNAEDRFLVSCLTDDELLDMLLSAHAFLMAQADPDAWLNACLHAPDGAQDAPWRAEITRQAVAGLRAARAMWTLCGEALCMPNAPDWYQPVCENDGTLLDAMEAAAQEGVAVPAPDFMRLPIRRAPCDEAAKAAFCDSRNAMKAAAKAALELLTPETRAQADDMAAMRPAFAALARALMDMRSRFDQEKDRLNLLDFTDLEHRAIRALNDPMCRNTVRGGLRAIFVDEYQDVSAVQEAIVRRLFGEGCSLFMVGDVKQSIYRFRLADPTLFLNKYNTFSQAADSPRRLILLSRNFRSQPRVLSAVNCVFEGAMRVAVTELDYDERARLIPGDDAALPGPAARFHVIGDWRMQGDDGDAPPDTPDAPDTNGPERADAHQREAALISTLIRSMVGADMTVDARTHAPRPLEYRDFAVLLRSASGRAAIIMERLSADGIPVYGEADVQYFDQPDVADILALLRVLDNPLDDVSLLALLRGPVFGIDDETLAGVRLRAPRREDGAPDEPYWLDLEHDMASPAPEAQPFREAMARVGAWRFLSGALSVSALIWRLLGETGLYARAGALPDGAARQANLRLLCERAADARSLPDFLAHVEETIRADDGVSAKTLGEKENVVRVMTIHKSKGLEFPVVIMAELAAPFKTTRDQLLLLDDTLGAAMKRIDPDNRVRRQTLKHRALAFKKARESLAEEARLLYVGMTRAKERLHLIATPRSMKATLSRWRMPPGEGAAGSARAMADWVGQAALRPGAQQDIECVKWLPEQLPAVAGEAEAVLPPETDGGVSASVAEMMSRPKPDLRYRPLKTTVTALTRAAFSWDDETPEDKRVPVDETALPSLSPLPDLPDFSAVRALTGAQRGTAAHQALGLMDLSALRGKTGEALESAVSGALSALSASGALSTLEGRSLPTAWLTRFFAGEWGTRLLRAQTVRREWSFNLRAPGGQWLLQGVLDACFLEDGQWVLVDYKTDDATLDELSARYARQLALYADALTRITGVPVREGALYSLRAGEAARFTGNALSAMACGIWQR